MIDKNRMSEIQMRAHLREAFSQDPEKSFLVQTARRLADPAKPLNEKGLPRPHRLLLQVGIIFFLALFVFLYFSFGTH